jgi:hypothetical protein
LPAQAAGEEPRTVMERRSWAQFTPYDSMITYLGRLQTRSKEMRLGYYGETWEGRKLPYVVFSRPLVAEAWEAAALGKPVVVLNGNVHGGERTLRESLLILTRELSTAGTEANRLLDDIVVVIAPQINPDGFVAGDRGNLWGIDLNRDYLKLEQPEIAAYVKNILNTWHPHVFVDGHNGCAAPYNICYQAHSHADPDQRITEMADKEIFPAINARLAPLRMKGFYYQGGNANRWTTGGYEGRIGRNYGGFSNSVGILFESPGGQNAETGVQAGILSFKAVLEYVQKNPQKVMNLINTARRETIEMGMQPRGQVAVQMRYGPEDWPVTYEIRATAPDTGFRTIRSDSLMKKPIATLLRDRPYAYILPRDARDAVAMLRRHNIAVEELTDTIQVDVQVYRIGSVRHEAMYNHAAATVITVDSVFTQRRTFPKGTFAVRTGQMLGRVVSHLLEAESTDNVIYWNTMDAWIPRGTAGRGGAGGGGRGGAAGGAGRGAGAGAAAGGAGRGGAAGAAAAGGRGAGGGGAGALDPDEAPPPPPQAGGPLVPIYKLMTARGLPARFVP